MCKIIRTLKPQESPLFEARLLWMRDNQPELLMELYNKKELQKKILEDVEQAQNRFSTLIQNGVDLEVAREIRLDLLAPAEGMDEDKEVMQIPKKLWNQIIEDVTS